jgi:hypothetical protein
MVEKGKLDEQHTVVFYSTLLRLWLAGSECDFVTFPEDACLILANFRAVDLDKAQSEERESR